MNSVRLVHILSSGVAYPIMPVDMAVRVCLASSPPLRSFLSNYPSPVLRRCEPLRPCLSNVAMASVTSASSDLDGGQAWRKRKKKSVVFADSRGLALTTVHIFNEAEDHQLTELQFQLSEIEGSIASLHLENDAESADSGSSLVLDFIPPSLDYLDLRNRLKAQQVCLETCSVQDHLVSGTIQVRNLSFEKSVSVRITFDSWCSFQDVPCRYLNNIYGSVETNTFSFSVQVPGVLESTNTVEFCINYQAQDQTYWDNNHGNNYRLVVVERGPAQLPESAVCVGLEIQGGVNTEKMEIDPFGSPRTSAGIFPEWQSWGRVVTGAPYW